jgi:hypothetical protein
MKWVSLILLLAAIIPVSEWTRRNPRQAPKLWMLLGFLPFALSFVHLNMAVISWLDWPGYVKGAEFSLLDGLAIALYRATPAPHQPMPFRLPMLLYFFASMLSALQAPVPMAALFYSLQLIRVFFVYATVARACSDPRVPVAILKGMTAGLIVEVVVATWQRFGLEMLQAHGTMDHQNILGMMIHFVAIPAFALVLSGRAGLLLTAAASLGIVVDVLTTSRGALGFSLLGYSLVFVISSLRSWTPRKRTVLMAGLAGLVVIMPIAISSFDKRFEEQSTLVSSDYDERAAFEKAAGLMLSNNPLGQGANHYVFVGNLDGYNNRAGVTFARNSEGANVHNVYFLVAAETGYPGLITFLLLLISLIVPAFLCGWNRRNDRRGDLLLGLGVALLIVYVHSLFEWVFVLLETQYMFAMDAGMVAGLAVQLGYWARPPHLASSLQAAPLPASSLSRRYADPGVENP